MLLNTNGSSTSAWMATASVPEYPPLQGDTSADVCVIGAAARNREPVNDNAGITPAFLTAALARRTSNYITSGPA